MKLFNIIIIAIWAVSAFLFIAGFVMFHKYRKEKFRFLWSILMITSAIVIAAEALIAYNNSGTFFTSGFIPFKLSLLLEWHFIALQVSVLCVIALQGRISRKQILIFGGILFSCGLIALCYEYFNGTYTPLHHFSDIIDNIDKKDVQVKVLLFVFSLVSTMYLLYFPFYKSLFRKRLKLTKWFNFYIFFAHLQPIAYIFYALGSPISGIVLVVGCGIFITIFSLVLLHNENPMVEIIPGGNKQEEEIARTIGYLYESIKRNRYFLDKTITLDSLAEKTGLYPHEIMNEYQKKGFNDFQQFLDAFRFLYYNQLKADFPKIPDEILIKDSGFASVDAFNLYKSTFKQ